MKKDIENREDVMLMVDTFYTRIRSNELLGPIFNNRIGNNWTSHLEKMYRFWETVLLGNHTYNGAPFPPHATMQLEGFHFETWVKVFTDVVSELSEGDVANEAIHRGTLMAAIFNSKIQHFNSHKAL